MVTPFKSATEIAGCSRANWIEAVATQDAPLFVGIDPGASGGIAVICGEELITSAVPKDEDELLSLMLSLQDMRWTVDSATGKQFFRSGGVLGAIEQVTGWIGWKKSKTGEVETHGGQPSSAMFKFGQSYGTLRMAAIAAGVQLQSVVPTTWQKEFGLKKRGMARTAWKGLLKSKAMELFPNQKITLDVADAVLIAEFCRRKHG